MKPIFTLFIFLLVSVFSYAQSARTTTVEYNGQKYPAYIIEYNLPEEQTENVITAKLKEEGFSPSKSKGFLVYRNVKLTNLDSDNTYDVFFKINRKSRKENDITEVTLITAKPGQIPEDKVKGAKGLADIEASYNSDSFLASFEKEIKLAEYNLQLDAQINEVAKAEKNMDKLLEEQKKLEKKIKELQEELATNQKNQIKKTDEVARQKLLLQQKKDAHPVD